LQKNRVFTLVVIIANFCGIFLKESYRTNITYFQVMGTPMQPCDYMTADYVTNVNLGFEQFATAAGFYAAKNPLCPCITFQ